MRTRSQLASRKHAREDEEAAMAQRAGLPSGSPRQCAAAPTTVELLSPPLKRMRPLPSASPSVASSARGAKAKQGEEEPPLLRRTLQYDEEDSTRRSQIARGHSPLSDDDSCDDATQCIAANALSDDSTSVLRRICAGQWLRHKGGVVGRTSHKRRIRAVLDGSADDGSTCLFLVGPPGTGKTSCVDELLASHSRRDRAAVRINCSTFANPSALYAEIAHRLGASRGGKQRAAAAWLPASLNASALDRFLVRVSGAKAQAADVLVLDEVDHLLRLPARQQARVAQLLRFLVQWSALSPSLKLLGIMNGIDMYARISRALAVAGQAPVDVPHVTFGSYSHEELSDILRHYASSAVASAASTGTAGAAAVDARALELIARKVAARDGDARRAISLLQQCARSALNRPSTAAGIDLARAPAAVVPAPTINLRDAMQSATGLLSTPLAKQIAQLPRQPKLLLYVLTTLAPSGEARWSDLNAVRAELERLGAGADGAWLPRFSREELVRHVGTLECYALVRRDARRRAAGPSAKAFWSARLGSAATMEDVTRALGSDDALRQALRPSA